MASPTEFRVLGPEHVNELVLFFEALTLSSDEKFFHPHPLTAEEARRRSAYKGKDLYLVALDGIEIVGYGMLRGWDEGYEIPSLGIAVHPSRRREGLGRALMAELHKTARERGAHRVRLSVHHENLEAIRLYEELGYRFVVESGEQLIGTIDL